MYYFLPWFLYQCTQQHLKSIQTQNMMLFSRPRWITPSEICMILFSKIQLVVCYQCCILIS